MQCGVCMTPCFGHKRRLALAIGIGHFANIVYSFFSEVCFVRRSNLLCFRWQQTLQHKPREKSILKHPSPHCPCKRGHLVQVMPGRCCNYPSPSHHRRHTACKADKTFPSSPSGHYHQHHSSQSNIRCRKIGFSCSPNARCRR